MLHFHIISVEPLPSHPKFFEVQAGWATVILPECEESEEVAKAYLLKQHFKALEVQDSRAVPPDKYHLLPPGALKSLRRFPLYCEISAYETGGGPEKPGLLFPEDNEG